MLNNNSELQIIIQRIENNMIAISGGTFMMGCTAEQGKDCDGDERPVHEVTLSGYYLGKYEVTQAEWRAVMEADPEELAFPGCDQCPVEGVSWDDVQEFIKKLNSLTGKRYRLPTEAEWEYAARGGRDSKGYKYSGSNNLDEVGWYNWNSGNKTHPVGQKRRNELRLYDMSGNVWEWCSDWYGSYSGSSQTNPRGPSKGNFRVSRGGSWHSYARRCRVSYRYSNGPAGRSTTWVSAWPAVQVEDQRTGDRWLASDGRSRLPRVPVAVGIVGEGLAGGGRFFFGKWVIKKVRYADKSCLR